MVAVGLWVGLWDCAWDRRGEERAGMVGEVVVCDVADLCVGW